jgi:glycosyltransferase involved in cell wall biosynthesis
MRVGHNPARFIEKVAQPAEITVTVVNYIPFLSGYYEQSLEVLKAVVESLHATRESEHPYDVMVFDNHSCAEVRAYLQEATAAGKIQYLVLSNTNIGKIGAWNYMFGAAQGKYVAFADGDVGFRPGWLSASLELFETFPNVGMVTARPLRTPMEFSSATVEWGSGQPGALEVGPFLDWDTYWEHVRSVGMTEEKALAEFPGDKDYRLIHEGKAAFIGATHFQFMMPKHVIDKILPLHSNQPMRGERQLDIKINELGYLRLLTSGAYVWHMGNCISDSNPVQPASSPRQSLLTRILYWPPVRRVLLWLNNQIFRLYFFHPDRSVPK